MPSSYEGSDQQAGDTIYVSQPFDVDYIGSDKSERFNSFSNFDDSESIQESAAEGSPVLASQSIPGSPSVLPIYGSGGGYRSDAAMFSQENYEHAVESDNSAADGPILPSPVEMQSEEGYALREWRRENAIRLEEKEKREKESLIQIIDDAEEYKVEFYKKREVACAANKSLNREKEKLFLSSLEKFHAEADKSYWKAIAELVPNEVPVIEKRGKKEQDKKPSVVVIQGPKPGKPADLSRMRQILIKLKHNTPTHLKHSPPAPVATEDAKSKAAVVAA